MKIKILVDSGSDIPHDFAERLNIGVVPLTISFGDESKKDYYDITPEEFFAKISEAKELPKTSQPNPYEFENEFMKYKDDYDAILCITMSCHGSGTYQSALMAEKNLAAKKDFKPEIHIFDSKNASLALTLLAETAAKMAEKNNSVSEIITALSGIRDNMVALFITETLYYLQKGGRVGTVTSLLGGLFHFKAIITIVEGFGRNYGKVRGQNGVIAKLEELYFEKAANVNGRIFISHANCAERAEELKAKILLRAPDADITVTSMGCTMGTHAGPGAVGIFFAGSKKHTLV